MSEQMPSYRADAVLPLHRSEAWYVNESWVVLCAICGPIYQHDTECQCQNADSHAMRWALRHARING